MVDPIFTRFTAPPRRLLCRHIFGPANPSGDACSRSRPALAEQSWSGRWASIPCGCSSHQGRWPTSTASSLASSRRALRKRSQPRRQLRAFRGRGSSRLLPALPAAGGRRNGAVHHDGRSGPRLRPGTAALVSVANTPQHTRSSAPSHGRWGVGPRLRHQLVAASRAAVRPRLGGAMPLHAFTVRSGLVQSAGLRSHPELPVPATATRRR
jgi:hypothetical protein